MAAYKIVNGPNKWDLMLALFDVEGGLRTVKFRIKAGRDELKILQDGGTAEGYDDRYDVCHPEVEGDLEVKLELVRQMSGLETVWWELAGRVCTEAHEKLGPTNNYVHIVFYDVQKRAGELKVQSYPVEMLGERAFRDFRR